MSRSGDLPGAELSKLNFTDVVVVIPGKGEPANLDVYLKPLFEDLKDAGPKGRKPSSCRRRKSGFL